jgi:trimeric autotransporter adhesin
MLGPSAETFMLDHLARSAVGLTMLAATATSQCSLDWIAANGYPGTNGAVRAITRWDPDGPGPSVEHIVVAGYFTAAGGRLADNVAAFDPSTGQWSAIGAGLPGVQGSHVRALITLPSGTLVAAGNMPPGNVVVWTGTSWQPLGFLGAAGVTIDLYGGALAVRAGGELLVGGDRGVAQWTGATWQNIGTTDWWGHVLSLLVLPSGELVAGGAFTSMGNVPASNVARWDGTTWQAMGAGLPGGVGSLALLPSGDIVATGTGVGPQSFGVMRWNGSTWASLGGGFAGDVLTSAVLANGDLVVGGLFGGPGTRLARWDGAAWHAMGSGADNSVFALLPLPGGDVIVGGFFRNIDGTGRRYVARWNGTWSSLGSGFDEQVRDFAVLPNGDVLAGGDFTHAGDVDARRVARWSGGAWHALGSGVDGAFPSVRAIEALPNGDVVVGGSFTAAGGTSASALARFDGSQWHAMGATTGVVYTLLELSNGDLLVGGYFFLNGAPTHLARWSPAGWSTLPAAPNGAVHEAILLANGELLISGVFTAVGATPANGIARGNGTTWTALGSGLGGQGDVPCLAEMPDGGIVVAGSFTTAGGAPIATIAQWNGAQWLPLGAAQPFWYVRTFAKLPGGDLAVGGVFQLFPPPGHIARWNGTTWTTMATMQGSVTGGSVGSYTEVQAMEMLPEGHLAVSGWFLRAGSVVSPYLAALGSTCRARIVSAGAGCAGTGGMNELEATTLPWLESTFRARATGLAPNALAVAVWAFQQLQLPMPAVHPQGLPGCTLLLADHILIDFPNSAGTVATSIAIPNDPNLVGSDFFHQVVAIELGAGSAITALTSTNALAATVGVW